MKRTHDHALSGWMRYSRTMGVLAACACAQFILPSTAHSFDDPAVDASLKEFDSLVFSVPRGSGFPEIIYKDDGQVVLHVFGPKNPRGLALIDEFADDLRKISGREISIELSNSLEELKTRNSAAVAVDPPIGSLFFFFPSRRPDHDARTRYRELITEFHKRFRKEESTDDILAKADYDDRFCGGEYFISGARIVSGYSIFNLSHPQLGSYAVLCPMLQLLHAMGLTGIDYVALPRYLEFQDGKITLGPVGELYLTILYDKSLRAGAIKSDSLPVVSELIARFNSRN